MPKHELGNSVRTERSFKLMASCAGCNKKAPREGIMGLPKGWLGYSNPLYGEPWVVEVCSWKCEHEARMRSVAEAQRKRVAAT